MPHLLAFDTATEMLAVALHTPHGDFTVTAAGGAAASTTLVPHIEAVLARGGAAWADLDAIAFGNGPGAFTGLRTACAVAQGIGLGTGRPLLPLDSLLVVADDARAQTGAADVVVLMDARMDEVYAARYRWHGSSWTVVQAPMLGALPALTGLLWAGDLPALFAGSALAAFGSRLQLPPAVDRCGHEGSRAAALLRLAVQAWRSGDAVDAAAALPLYLRDKVAQTTLERAAAAATR